MTDIDGLLKDAPIPLQAQIDCVQREIDLRQRVYPRWIDDGITVEILRVCTDGTHNCCSMLYGACRRAATALGYRRIVTYTLPSEGGASLRAAGYHTGVQGPTIPRCDRCKHCTAARPPGASTSRDRSCGLFRYGVKTHGVCNKWVAR